MSGKTFVTIAAADARCLHVDPVEGAESEIPGSHAINMALVRWVVMTPRARTLRFFFSRREEIRAEFHNPQGYERVLEQLRPMEAHHGPIT